MYPQAQTVENIEGLKQDPIMTYRVLKERKNIAYFKGCVCVCVSDCCVRAVDYTQRTLVKDYICRTHIACMWNLWIVADLHAALNLMQIFIFSCATQLVLHCWHYQWYGPISDKGSRPINKHQSRHRWSSYHQCPQPWWVYVRDRTSCPLPQCKLHAEVACQTCVTVGLWIHRQ